MNPSSHTRPEGEQSHRRAHIASMFELVAVFGALMVLTGLTVGLAYVDLGEANLTITLLIATTKACLVALFFMHLRHDTGFNRLAFFGSFLFVMLFIGITLTDTSQSGPKMDWKEQVLKQDK
ncbi:MAG: caa(3)-type oxidase subunit IV [Deltaproteobacteria bacterium]|nr:MAG: caa(3)-type oxidase subunit IV [Deltaproteobacteria bacterium]